MADKSGSATGRKIKRKGTMQRKSMAKSQYLCVDGDMPLLQEGIRVVVCKEIPDIRLLNPEDICEREPVLLILCIAEPQRAMALLCRYREKYPLLKVLLLYDRATSADMLSPLPFECHCVAKSSLSKEELFSCIHMVRSSFFVWDKDIAPQLLGEVKKHHSFIQMMKKEIVINTPTHREIEIAKCILAGMDNEDIGKKLYLSTGTIKNMIAVILEKYHFRSRAQIISLLAL